MSTPDNPNDPFSNPEPIQTTDPVSAESPPQNPYQQPNQATPYGQQTPPQTYGQPLPAGYPYPGYPYQQPATESRALGIIALIMSFTCCLSPVAVILGIVALFQGAKNRTLGIIAIIIGVIFSILAVLGFYFIGQLDEKDAMKVINSAARNSDGQIKKEMEFFKSLLRVEDCVLHEISEQVPRSLDYSDPQISVTPCRNSHNFEVISLIKYPGTTYPGESKFYRWAKQVCKKEAIRFINANRVPKGFQYVYYIPSSRTWRSQDDRNTTCLLGHHKQTTTGKLID